MNTLFATRATHETLGDAAPPAAYRLPPRDDPRLRAFGWGPRATPTHECVHHAIDAQVALHPQAVAIEHEGVAVTYAELDRLARRIQVRLVACGVRRGAAVGLFMRRGIPLVAGMLAVMRLGAAYVPQDAGVVPLPLLQQVVDSAGLRIVLTTSDRAGALGVLEGCEAIAVDTLPHDAAAHEAASNVADVPCRPDDRCFILFTSGTTGVPNGVEVTHGNVCNLLLTTPGNLGICPGQRVGQILAIGFDMAAWETLGCLAHGATLCIRGSDIAACAARVDVLIATPSILARLRPQDCPRVRVIALAGEPCPQPLAEQWARVCRFYVGCGPTEVTIVNTLGEYRCGDASVTIGKPTPNNTVYVLDERLRPCPIGEVGEMWAGGDCVSLGYVNNPRLTDERYRPDPFLGGGRRMFRTRDLGRWTADGSLEYFGRVDDQVKVRGFRVELDSVSAVLESTPGCLRAATLKLSDTELVAFVTPAHVDVDAARERVRARLPYYCVPVRVIALDELPITPRGKVDRQVLLERARCERAASTEVAA